jgi:hypothetical protein
MKFEWDERDHCGVLLIVHDATLCRTGVRRACWHNHVAPFALTVGAEVVRYRFFYIQSEMMISIALDGAFPPPTSSCTAASSSAHTLCARSRSACHPSACPSTALFRSLFCFLLCSPTSCLPAVYSQVLQPSYHWTYDLMHGSTHLQGT